MGLGMSRCEAPKAVECLKEEEEVDMYRNTSLRYMGYCNEASIFTSGLKMLTCVFTL